MPKVSLLETLDLYVRRRLIRYSREPSREKVLGNDKWEREMFDFVDLMVP